MCDHYIVMQRAVQCNTIYSSPSLSKYFSLHSHNSDARSAFWEFSEAATGLHAWTHRPAGTQPRVESWGGSGDVQYDTPESQYACFAAFSGEQSATLWSLLTVNSPEGW
eukprot:1182136-Prorocentrum_minimum.AAC.3